VWWFTFIVGLNAFDFILGIDLPKDLVLKVDYERCWGPKNYSNGSHYKRRVSLKMVCQIKYLYQRIFQRPIGANDVIPYHFGRGLVAEQMGILVNWATYARKMIYRGTGNRVHFDSPITCNARFQGNGKGEGSTPLSAIAAKKTTGMMKGGKPF